MLCVTGIISLRFSVIAGARVPRKGLWTYLYVFLALTRVYELKQGVVRLHQRVRLLFLHEIRDPPFQIRFLERFIVLLGFSHSLSKRFA